MYRKLSQHTDRVVGFRAEGRMSREDYRLIANQVEDALSEYGSPLCLLVEIRDLQGMEPGALWDDLKFSVKHWHDVDSMAVVGDGDWLERWAHVGGAIAPTEVKHFDSGEIHDAWEWIRDRDRQLRQRLQQEAMQAEPAPTRRILVAVDMTPSSHFVIRSANLLAEKIGASLALIHVVDFMPAVEFGFSWTTAGTELPEPGELEKPALEKLRKLAKELGVGTADAMARAGDPRSRILEAADEIGADLIVIGNKSRQGLGRLLGSTANGVVHAARCSVLTVPVPKPH